MGFVQVRLEVVAIGASNVIGYVKRLLSIMKNKIDLNKYRYYEKVTIHCKH
jgi:hypothetical protein